MDKHFEELLAYKAEHGNLKIARLYGVNESNLLGRVGGKHIRREYATIESKKETRQSLSLRRESKP